MRILFTCLILNNRYFWKKSLRYFFLKLLIPSRESLLSVNRLTPFIALLLNLNSKGWYMKKIAISTLSALAVLAALNTNALASDGTITFNGEIASQTCSIASGGDNLTVTLPTVSAVGLNSAGATAGNIGFAIALTDCDTSVNSVYANFEAGTNVDADGRLTTTGSATNVAVQLLDSASTPIVVGSDQQQDSASTATIDSSGNATLNYSAQYYATGAATAGSVSTSVTYSLVYL